MIVESSPDRWHAYWLVTGCPLNQFTAAQKALAARFGGDPSVCDLPRVMRVPGFLHRKRAPFVSRVHSEAALQPYDFETLVARLGLDLAGDAVPQARVAAAARQPGGKKVGEGGRHAHLLRRVGDLNWRGMSREAIRLEVNRENDEVCKPPLDDAEVGSIVDDVCRRYAHQNGRDLIGPDGIVIGRGRGQDHRPLARKLEYVFADQLSEADEVFDDEFVEGALQRNTTSVVFGTSNSGKTFCAIDLGCAVARGTSWLGRRCVAGLVVYLATEASRSVERRLQAYQRQWGVKVRGFVIVKSPINLFDGDADVTAVIALLNEIEQEQGQKVSLIIGDTLSRISAGANENSGEDMAVVMKNADVIRAAVGAAFVWIHHNGKDQAKGMRGWSGMNAWIETEFEVKVDEATGTRIVEVTKQRDLPGKGDRLGFRLEPVHLGMNRWGTPRGSCVVMPTDAPPKPSRGKRPSQIAGAIEEFLLEHGSGCIRGSMVAHFEGRYARASVYKEIKKMIVSGDLLEVAGAVALPGKPGPAA